MRLIDADKAASIENLDDYGDFALGIGDMEDARELLNDAPTVDAVPVVRCEKCRFKDRPSCPGFDALQGMTNLSLGFCSNGARKDDNHA